MVVWFVEVLVYCPDVPAIDYTFGQAWGWKHCPRKENRAVHNQYDKWIIWGRGTTAQSSLQIYMRDSGL